jgi:hypothetical protein
MLTSIIVERSPGGGNGWNIQAGKKSRFIQGCERDALAEPWHLLAAQDCYAEVEERERVTGLLRRELRRVRRAEVQAEVRT